MDDSTFGFVVVIFFVIFMLIQLLQKLIYKIRDRNRYYFIRRERSKWKQRLISALVSFVSTSGIIVIFLKSNESNSLISNFELSSEGIFVSLSSILICSLAYIYGNRRGEKLSRGLRPIIRESVSTSLSNYPYRTIRQAYTFPSYGRYPSDHEALQWREETRDFASGKAMWLTLYILYVLVLLEGFIGIIIVAGGISLDISSMSEFAKAIGMMLSVGFFAFSIISIMFHIPIIWIIEFIGRIMNIEESKTVEWIKLVSHSILFNISIISFYKVVDRLG